MLSDYIHPLAHYNLWAHERLAQTLLTLTEEQLQQDVISSFASIHKTVLHIHQAEDTWRQRLLEIAPTIPYALPAGATGAYNVEVMLDSTRIFTNTLLAFSSEQLAAVIHYTNVKGEAYASPCWQLVQHVVNHSTYHRGQLVTMLRQLGLTTIPSTDLAAYYRGEGKR